MSFKEPKISTGSIKCCQSNPSMEDLSECPILNGNNNNNIPDMVKAHCFPKRQEVDVEFSDIKYSSTSWTFPKFRRETKSILHGVSGKFKSGELSVIMGPSGAGKSSLLNILAGFVTRGSSGEVKLNNVVRDSSPRFRKLSAYIPQNEELRLALTVKEAMTFAANLKLGYSVSQQYKATQVIELLELLGLDQCLHTLTSRLSGGQRKRLAVALELLSNPPVLFLDEPTTGLDSSSCSHCIYLFKMLAKEGRTVICTIHQPSALLFEMFDKLYALTEGKCIYNGTTSNLVPYLDTFGLKCPSYHNPADFLMEVAMGEHGEDINALASAVRHDEIDGEYQEKALDAKEKEMLGNGFGFQNNVSELIDLPIPRPAPVIMQFFLLYKRNLITSKRNYMYWMNRLLAHILIGFLFGYLYRGVGANANQILANYIYMYGTVLLTVYTGKMSVTLSFPLEMRILTREHFNRWYKLTPYLLSVILIEIPFQVICTWTYIVISYWLTSQPLDFRVYLFVTYCTAATLCGQSMGYFIGATTPTKIAVFIGPVIACLLSIFGFCIRYYDIPAAFRWLFHISYFRAAFQSIVYSIYGCGRQRLNCPEEEVYCHYEDPEKFLTEMDVTNVNLVSNLSLIVGIWCLMHAATYLALWVKMNKR